MATPVFVDLPADTWTKIATNVLQGQVHLVGTGDNNRIAREDGAIVAEHRPALVAVLDVHGLALEAVAILLEDLLFHTGSASCPPYDSHIEVGLGSTGLRQRL